MQGYGLSVNAINSVTKMEIELEGRHIWKHVEPHTSAPYIPRDARDPRTPTTVANQKGQKQNIRTYR